MDGCRIPDDGILGSKVAVGEDVSKAGEGTPRNFRKRVGEGGWKVFYGLSNDLEVSCYGIHRAAVRNERIVIEAADISCNGRGRLQNVLKAQRRVT